MVALEGFGPLGRALILAAASAITLAFIKFAAPVVSPILLSIFIAAVAITPLRWMRRRGVPKWIALAIIIFILLDIGSIFALVTTGALETFRDSLPGYQERLSLLYEQLGAWLERSGVAGSSEALPDLLDPGAAMSLVRMGLASASGTFATGLLILLATSFMLLEAQELDAKLKNAFGLTPETEERLRRLVDSIKQYMWIKTLMSLATAVLIWIWLWMLGVDFAFLWAIFSFVLNYIPFVGAVIMMVPPVLMALVQTDIQTAVLVAVGVIAANAVIGSILEPRIMGSGLGVSPLAVFLSLVFWGWLLGATGAFLSVPLTIAFMIACEASPRTRPVAILLSMRSKEEASREVE